MNHLCRRDLLVISALLVVVIALSAETLSTAQDPSSTSPPASDPSSLASIDPSVQVLTQGNVHEAFGQPVVFDATPSPVLPNKPPDPVQEVIPSQKPEGDNVQWIPGYWSWDSDNNKFNWTSGIWRAIPPGLQWVSGYWTQSGTGYQWVSGFWQKIATVAAGADSGSANPGAIPGPADGTASGEPPAPEQEAATGTDSGTNPGDGTGVTYLPQPPDTLETGPVGDPPTADHIWIPGCWIYQAGSYAWLAGQWCPCHAGWVWVPAHYVWTPAGYVFVDGFWDYDLDHRGVLFAPVSFVQGIPAPGFVYTPTVCLNSDLFIDYLFCRPQCGCYCFGDYYAAVELQAGVYPCFAYHMSKFGFDPLFAYCSWQHHNDASWHDTLVADYRSRVANVALRPPQTYAAFVAQAKNAGGKTPKLALPLSKLAAQARPSSLRFTSLNAPQRQQMSQSIQNSLVAQGKRLQLEKQSQVRPPAKVAQNEPGRIPSGPSKPVTPPVRQPPVNQNPQRPITPPVRRPVVQTPQRPVRTPPVTPRRPVTPVSRPVTPQRVAGEHPAQRLSNPQYVPRPSNQGRTQPRPTGRR
jgi:hypothetical protein